MEFVLLSVVKRFKKTWIVASILLSTIYSNAQSYDSSGKYNLFLEPYLLLPALSGTTGIGNLPNTFICVPASKLLSNLKFGAMLYAELHNNKFAFNSDLFYASITEDASSKNGIAKGSLNVKQFLWELEALYSITPWWEAGFGVRINSIKTTLNINTTTQLGSRMYSDAVTNTWADPLIVTRLKKWIDNRWLLSLKADIGGFGIGSKFAWQLQPDIAWKASKLLQLGVGYRFLSTDYEKGSGNSRFLYDMEEYGPQIRIGFNL